MRMHLTGRGRRLALALALCTLGAVPAVAVNASGSPGVTLPTISPVSFASGASGQTLPDDITRLGSDIFVTFQNGVPATGPGPTGPQTSTIVEYDHSGGAVATWTLTGRCDGLTADPPRHRILATVDEDNNSYFAVIRPGDPTPRTYSYSPNPAEQAAGETSSNGGTDSITLGPDGAIYVAHSNPDPGVPNTAALYKLRLDGATAVLTPVFRVDDTATDVTTGNPVTLALTDPDSNRYLPASDPVLGGSILQGSQGDGEIVIVGRPGTDHPSLRRLVLSNAEVSGLQPTIDDMVEVTGPGTLYVVDQGAGTIQTIDTSGFTPGTIVIAQPADKTTSPQTVGQLGVLDPATGVITHFSNPFTSPKGLLFVPQRDSRGQDS